MDALIRDFVSQANDYDGGLTREGQEIAHCLLSAACDPDSIRRRKVLVAFFAGYCVQNGCRALFCGRGLRELRNKNGGVNKNGGWVPL